MGLKKGSSPERHQNLQDPGLWIPRGAVGGKAEIGARLHRPRDLNFTPQSLVTKREHCLGCQEGQGLRQGLV